MPATTGNMATPIANRTSRIFILPDTNAVCNQIRRQKNRKYKVLKFCEFVLAFGALTVFVFGDIYSAKTTKDLFICSNLGFVTAYPLVYSMFYVVCHKFPREALTLNVTNGVLLLLMSMEILKWWRELEADLNHVNDQKMYVDGELSATVRFITALLNVINGIIYLSESVVMTMEFKGYL